MTSLDLVFWWPIVVLEVACLVYLYLTWKHDYWKKRKVPYIKPLPLFGNMKDVGLMKKFIGDEYINLYKQLDGYKYGGIFKFSEPTLLVRDPEIIRDVLVREFSSFHDNEIMVDKDTDPMFGRNPFVLRGDSWKVTRDQLVPNFTIAKLKPLLPLIEEMCQELKNLLRSPENSDEADVKEVCARFTTDVVATCAYGIDGGAMKDPNSEMRRMGRNLLQPTFMNNLKLLLSLIFPWLPILLKIRFIPLEMEKYFVNMVKEIVRFREQKGVVRNDYLQNLINLKNKASSAEDVGFEFKDIDIAAQATTFFLDGFETSSGVMTFLLYALAINPEVQNKAREEVKAALKESGGEMTYDCLQKMTYLDKVLQETLRMYPPVPAIIRVCTKPMKIKHVAEEGYLNIEEGTPILIPVYALHHDGKYFPEPEVFDPERFSEENKNKYKYVYMPFGDGPRICLGARFGQLQVKMGAASILSSFEIRPSARTPIPVVAEPSHILLTAKGGMYLQFRELKS